MTNYIKYLCELSGMTANRGRLKVSFFSGHDLRFTMTYPELEQHLQNQQTPIYIMRQLLIRAVCARLSVTENELLHPSRRGIKKEARLILFLATYECVIKNYTQIAEWYGLKNHSSAWRNIEQARGFYASDNTFRKHVEEIKKCLN